MVASEDNPSRKAEQRLVADAWCGAGPSNGRTASVILFKFVQGHSNVQVALLMNKSRRDQIAAFRALAALHARWKRNTVMNPDLQVALMNACSCCSRHRHICRLATYSQHASELRPLLELPLPSASDTPVPAEATRAAGLDRSCKSPQQNVPPGPDLLSRPGAV